MAVNISIVEELMQEIDAFEPTKVARHIPRSMTISLDYFECSGLAHEYFLDLNEVYLKPKRKNAKTHVPNPDHIYEVFGKYSHESPDVVRTSIVDFVTCDPETFKERLVVVFTMLHHNLTSWLLKTKNRANPADKANLYGLCHLYSHHALAYTTRSIWSSLEWRGKYSVKDIKKYCDIHLVFLHGGILGQLHCKPQIPCHISATALKAPPLLIQDTSNVVVISSESDPENKGMPFHNEFNTATSPVRELDDHSYASLTPQKRAVVAQMKTTEIRNPNDHNYTESSDIPTEEDIQDEIITTGGKVILSKSDQVVISLEYQCNETLIEATEDRTELKEGTGENKNQSGSTTSLREIAMNDELPEETSQRVPDETTNYVNLEGRYHQTQSESDNASVAKAPDTEAQPSLALAQINLDKTERMDVLPAPEQNNMGNANDSKDKEHALPKDNLQKTNQGEENSKRQNLKACIIQLKELHKAERIRWLPESEKTPANIENKVYEMRNHNKNSNRGYSSRKRKSVNYKDQTSDDNDQDSDYEPKMSPPLPLDNKKHPSANRMAIQQGILSNGTSKLENAATLPDVIQDYSVSPQIPRPSNVTNLDTLDSLKEKDEVNPHHDVGKLPDETDNPTTSDSPSVSPKSDMPESDKNIKGVFKMKTISIRCAKDPRTFKCSQCDKRTTTLRELNAHYIANRHKLKCDICDKSFNMPGALRKHRYTHV